MDNIHLNELSDPFYAKIRKTNVDTLEITLPFRTCKFEGWKEGDELRLIACKVERKGEE